MRVPAYHDGESGRHGIEVETRELVKHVELGLTDLDAHGVR